MFFFNLDQVRYSLMCEKGNNSYSKKIYLCLKKSILFLYKLSTIDDLAVKLIDNCVPQSNTFH